MLTHTFELNLVDKENQLKIIRGITGISDETEALEHFAVQCVTYFVQPQEALDGLVRASRKTEAV